MDVNEMLDQAYESARISQMNADTAREAIRQRDILLDACGKIAGLDFEALSVTDRECLREAVRIANAAISATGLVAA